MTASADDSYRPELQRTVYSLFMRQVNNRWTAKNWAPEWALTVGHPATLNI